MSVLAPYRGEDGRVLPVLMASTQMLPIVSGAVVEAISPLSCCVSTTLHTKPSTMQPTLSAVFFASASNSIRASAEAESLQQ